VVTPQLATVLTPRDRMGREAATRLLARIAGESSDNRLLDVGFEISEGGSI